MTGLACKKIADEEVSCLKKTKGIWPAQVERLESFGYTQSDIQVTTLRFVSCLSKPNKTANQANVF
uniref:Uncharacterized protein n=1 Tax=Brassica campestris TaxID=3711 RepID=M4ESZ5_BRACM